MNEKLASIKVTNAFPIMGGGDSLESRLRKVGLRGFPDVRIYSQAELQTVFLSSQQVGELLYTPQPHVYRTNLERINLLADMFMADGIDIFNLDQAYDYLAYTGDGSATEWTMLPPVVERFAIDQHAEGGFDYSGLIGHELQARLQENGWRLNPALRSMMYANTGNLFRVINDGSHRVHAGFERGGVRVLEISGMTPGFPYYAAPQPYASVQVFPSETDSIELKQHVLTAPGHKQLYRQFPGAGIMSGGVRPPREGEHIA